MNKEEAEKHVHDFVQARMEGKPVQRAYDPDESEAKGWQDIGYGGVVQLTAGQGFLQLMRGAKSIIEDCNHDCEKGCLACVYITDAWCMPFLPDEVGWYPPNSFLMRQEAVAVLKLTEEKVDDDEIPNG